MYDVCEIMLQAKILHEIKILERMHKNILDYWL